MPGEFRVLEGELTFTEERGGVSVVVPDVSAEPDRVAPGPAELRDISTRWGIEFWTGPIDPSPVPATRSQG
jgi:hypothetical protein